MLFSLAGRGVGWDGTVKEIAKDRLQKFASADDPRLIFSSFSLSSTSQVSVNESKPRKPNLNFAINTGRVPSSGGPILGCWLFGWLVGWKGKPHIHHAENGFAALPS